MIKNLESKMEKMQESINKNLEELKNKHAKTNNTITEIKNTLLLGKVEMGVWQPKMSVDIYWYCCCCC